MIFLHREFTFAFGKHPEAPANLGQLNPIRNQPAAVPN